MEKIPKAKASRRSSKPPPYTERPPKLAGALRETVDILAALDQVQQTQTFRNGVTICTALIKIISNLLGSPRP